VFGNEVTAGFPLVYMINQTSSDAATQTKINKFINKQ
jgi:hypothetical protein